MLCGGNNYLMRVITVQLTFGTLEEAKTFTQSHITPYPIKFEPPHEKTNNVVSEQFQHKLSCTNTEDG